MTAFAANQVRERDQRQHDAEHVGVEDTAEDLGRSDEFGMRGVDPPECLCGAGVEAAQRHPARTDEQQEEGESHCRHECADQTRAEPQPESLVGGGKMVVDRLPQLPRHAVLCSPAAGLAHRFRQTR